MADKLVSIPSQDDLDNQINNIISQAKKEEREAVCRWLRSIRDMDSFGIVFLRDDEHIGYGAMFAEEIERGDHIEKE